MTDLRLEKYKTVLQDLEKRLTGEIQGLAAEIDSNRGGMQERDGDTSEEINTDLMLSENESVELAEVRAALDRMDNETFGTCQDCDGKIPATRLNVIPYTAFCVDCERAREATG